MVDLYLLAPLADWSANVDILRLLRLGKLVSCLRTVRTLHKAYEQNPAVELVANWLRNIMEGPNMHSVVHMGRPIIGQHRLTCSLSMDRTKMY